MALLPDRPKLRAWAIAFAGYTALALLLFGYKYLDFVTRHQAIDWRIPFVEEITGVYLALLLLPASVWAARRWPPRRRGIPLFVLRHLLAACAIGFVHTTLMAISRKILFPLLGLGHYDYGDMRVRYWMEGSMQLIVYALTVGFVWLLDRYKASRDLEVSQAQLQTELAQAQLRNLQLQLQPHFLFNALNAISSVMYEDVAAADAMVTRLSDFLRLTLRRADAQEVRLGDELELLDAYLGIMRARFEDTLEVRMDVDADARPAFVPQLILQPIVENSIRYGADPRTNLVEISIEARRVNGSLRMHVRDGGPGYHGAPEGVGLANTRKRLSRLYGNAGTFSLVNQPGGGLDVTIEVPWRQ
jgi:LytS/YehU family sensor histidine kinase